MGAGAAQNRGWEAAEAGFDLRPVGDVMVLLERTGISDEEEGKEEEEEDG